MKSIKWKQPPGNDTPFEWRPVLKGRKLCSPGCGLGCTLASYQKAMKEATKVCRGLGPGWMGYAEESTKGEWIWFVCPAYENGKYHALISKRPNAKYKFMAYIAEVDERWTSFGDTPRQALTGALQVGEQSVREARRTLQMVRNCLKEE